MPTPRRRLTVCRRASKDEKKMKRKKHGKKKVKKEIKAEKEDAEHVKKKVRKEIKAEEEDAGEGDTGRWSADRYRDAELKMTGIMQEEKARLGKPITRQELREKVRAHIGDTGLLDHLLKHMAGKVVAGGTERFHRRHNAEGVMEYWLEPAELDGIRREAGVSDLYWVPPPGWKRGDPVSPIEYGLAHSAAIRGELDGAKSEMERLRTHCETRVEKAAMDATKKLEFASHSWQEKYNGVVEKYNGVVEKNGALERQLASLSASVASLQGEMRLLKAKEATCV